MARDDGFLTRWSRRKVQVQRGGEPAQPSAATASADGPADPPAAVETAAPLGVPPASEAAGAGETAAPRQPEPPAPTLAEAQGLTPDADFTRFVGRDVDPQVRNAALKSLFGDPRYNVMDGLDIYIDDYGKPDPLPPGMLRQMVQSTLLGLFTDESDHNAAPGAAIAAADPAPPASTAPPGAAATAPTDAPIDEDTDLRLQPDDDAGRAGTEPGTGEDSGRQC
jgi:Protein of unknown function (DUF3306)